MFGPVETKLDEITTRRFINSIRGTGKSTQLLWTINKILEKGETCLLVTPETYLIKTYFSNNTLPQGLSVIHIDKLLKYLKRYPNEGNEYTIKDPCFISYKFVSLFNCDRIVIDPECYIKIIEQYLEKSQKLNNLMEQIKNIV